MNKTFKNLKNYADKVDFSISRLLKLYKRKSSDLDKANQMIEDLSKELLAKESANNNAKMQLESLMDLVKRS